MLPPGLDLAPMTPADVDEVVVLQRACWLEEGARHGSFTIPPLAETHEDVRRDVSRWTWLLLRRGPRLVGGARGRRAGDDWEIGRLMVAPDLAGRGVGRALLQIIEERAPADVRRYVLFTGAASARNIRIYERAGYRVTPPPLLAPPLLPPGLVFLAKPVAPHS